MPVSLLAREKEPLAGEGDNTSAVSVQRHVSESPARAARLPGGQMAAEMEQKRVEQSAGPDCGKTLPTCRTTDDDDDDDDRLKSC